MMVHIFFFSTSRSRTDTPVDKMMSSGAAQNQRPASAPGEDAPQADSADRNEVNASRLLLFTSLHQCQCSWSPLFFFSALGVTESRCIPRCISESLSHPVCSCRLGLQQFLE